MSVYDQFHDNLGNSKYFFITAENELNYNIREKENQTLIKTTMNTTTYGLYSIKHRAASDQNKISKDNAPKVSQRSDLA